MNIRTKYNIGDEVIPISLNINKERKKCELCKGEGLLNVVGSSRKVSCPDCYNGFVSTDKTIGWELRVGYVSKIGKLEVSIEGKEREERYMIEATGVGTGSIWRSKDLFTTIEEAKKECAKRNSKL